MEQVKKYKVLLAVAVVVLGAVGSGTYFYMNGGKSVPAEPVKKAPSSLLEGQVIRDVEGENKILYRMEIPETSTSTTGMDGALIKVTNEGAPLVSLYFSYEGRRGYIASDYINHVISPKVRGVAITGTTTIGLYTWTVAESSASEWHVAQVGDGQWLLIVENKKALHDNVRKVLDTLITQ